MNENVRKAMGDSKSDFLAVVVPRILPILGGGEIVSVEDVSAHGFVKDLDTLAGIDAWHLVRGQSVMRGVASRVQWKKDWRSFTIRTRTASGQETEYDKRMRALTEADRGWLCPHVMVQAYLTEPGGTLLSVAIARTTDIMWCVAQGLCGSDREIPNGDGTWFKPVFWKGMLGLEGRSIVVLSGDRSIDRELF